MDRITLFKDYCSICKYNRTCYLQNNRNNEFVCLIEEKMFKEAFKKENSKG